jgi:hypothetical protein
MNACLISSQVHSTTLPPLRWSGRAEAAARGANDTGRACAGQAAGMGRQAAVTLAGPLEPPAAMSELLVPVSYGELLDKIAILQIKSERMTDPDKLANVRRDTS